MNQTVQTRPIVLPFRPSKLLSSWKEIAAYVGKGVRTVQRWERDHGFPVRRPNAELRGIVIAIPAEIEAWIAGNGVIAMPDEIDRRIDEDASSNGEASVEEELARVSGENADLRQQVAELRARLKELQAGRKSY